MRAAPSAQEGAGAVDPSPGDQPAPSTTRDAAMEFWRRVARGIVRLSPETDALITTLRKQGLGWVEVTERVRAAHVREQRGAIQARFRERQRGLRWREEYRQTKQGTR